MEGKSFKVLVPEVFCRLNHRTKTSRNILCALIIVRLAKALIRILQEETPQI